MAMATGAAVVAKSVASKAAVNAAATLGKGLAKKGAAEVGKGLGALADGSRDFLAASMAFQQVGQAFRVTGPAMSLLAAEFTSATMESRMNLSMSLVNLIKSPGFESAFKNFTDFINVLIDSGTDLVELTTTLANTKSIENFNRSVSLLISAIQVVSINFDRLTDKIENFITKLDNVLNKITPNLPDIKYPPGGGGDYSIPTPPSKQEPIRITGGNLTW